MKYISLQTERSKILRNIKDYIQHYHIRRYSQSVKWGYIPTNDTYLKQDKDVYGLYNLKTLYLPQELQQNLDKYLKNFQRKVLISDGLKLSRHLLNRGRPTDQTWLKYKNSKIIGSLTNNAQTDNSQTKNSMKKPKLSEYKIIRYQKEETAAYAADRIPANYGATFRVLHEISKRERDFQPKTLLDFGSGLGTATWAAYKTWMEYIKIYQCIDISPTMNKTAEYLLTNNNGPRDAALIPGVYFKDYLPVSDMVTYDIVIASYSLSEIPFPKIRKSILENLWRKTNKYLIVIERGNNEGFNIVIEARNIITDNKDSTSETEAGGNGHVFMPCPHELACPRLNATKHNHPCNFEQRVQLSFAQKETPLKKYGYYNERFSYVVLKKGNRDENERQWPRLIQPPVLRRRHVVCKICSKNGSLNQVTLTKKKDSDIYKCLRHRTKWGDLVPLDKQDI